MTRPLPAALALAPLAIALACGGPRPIPGPAPAAHPAEAGPAPAGPPTPGRYGPEPAAEPSAIERAILDELRARHPAPSSLHASSALALAARELARSAAAGVGDPLAPTRVRTALARSLSFDPAPRAYQVEASGGATATSLAASITTNASDTHAGIGAVTSGGRIQIVVLVSSRTVTLEPFPREAARGQKAVLRGRLLALSRPSVHVTLPSGESRTVPTRTDGARFESTIHFETTGRWTVEVVGESALGPEVVALLTVSCGGASLAAAPNVDAPDPVDPREAEARVVAAINVTRGRQRLGALEPSRALSEVARQHSEAMLRAGILAHRLDGSSGAAERLRRARIPFTVVLENVAKGPSAIVAHRLAEESPAHRQNILAPEPTRVGIGMAKGALAGGDSVVYLTELFVAPAGEPETDPLTPDARAREAIWRERARRGAPALVADPVLDQLARNAVTEMLRRGEPDPGDLPDRALAAGRKIAAADAFVVGKAADAARSRNLGDARFNRVGLAVRVGDDERYGAGRLWIAVIYTD